MNATARFEIVNAVIGDDAESTAIIKDCSTFQVIDSSFGQITVGSGYVRQVGQRYIGSAGRETAFMAGSDGDVYYAPVSYCDGGWRSAGTNRQGLHDYVTAGSGTGKLFAELEKFAASQAAR